MELKVWVDGIQRVVCGATFDTTCQDVVIALAHAMGRTGRFTLIEKFRDNERPVTPAECPLRALQKWGEYAGEVRFILCQADTKDQKSQDKLSKKLSDSGNVSRDHSGSRDNYNSVLANSTVHGDATVKRSLTFSGAHNQPLEESSWLFSSAPTSKLRKTNLGPVPNGDAGQPLGPLPHCQNPPQSLPRHIKDTQRTLPHQQSNSMPPPSSPSVAHHNQQQQHPVPPPRHRSTPSPLHQDNIEHNCPVPSAFSGPGSSGLRAQSVMPPLSSSPDHTTRATSLPSSQQQPHQVFRPQPQHHPNSPAHSRSTSVQPASQSLQQPQPINRVSSSQNQKSQPSQPHSQPNRPSLYQPPPANQRDASPEPPPLPKTPPPSSPSKRAEAMSDHHQTLAAIEASILASDHSRKASLEIEEYDLDRNFPDSHQSCSSRSAGGERDHPAVGMEYKLDSGLQSSGQGSGGHQLEGEHAKLLRLVNMQQERLKTQESQLSFINTEILAMEEKDKEYEEKLQLIMEELLLQETRQRDFDTELTDLERVEWDSVLHGEQQHEIDLNLNIATLKAKVIEQQQQLEDVKAREQKLLAELKEEEKKVKEEKEKLKADEARSREEEARNREEISKLQTGFADLKKKATEHETSRTEVENELSAEDKNLAEKQQELNNLEVSLKDENLKDFASEPVPKEDTKDSGETIIGILEGRLSARPSTTTTTVPNKVLPKTHTTIATPPLISALATKNQSGVWV